MSKKLKIILPIVIIFIIVVIIVISVLNASKTNSNLVESSDYTNIPNASGNNPENTENNKSNIVNNTEIIFKIGDKYINKYGFITDFVDNSAVEIKGINIKNIQEKFSDELSQNLNELYRSLSDNELLDLIDLIEISNEYDITIYMNSEKKAIKFGDFLKANIKCKYIKNILNIESGNIGEIIVNVDLDKGENPYFRETTIEFPPDRKNKKLETSPKEEAIDPTIIYTDNELKKVILTEAEKNTKGFWVLDKYNLYKILPDNKVIILLKYDYPEPLHKYFLYEVDLKSKKIIHSTVAFTEENQAEWAYKAEIWK